MGHVVTNTHHVITFTANLRACSASTGLLVCRYIYTQVFQTETECIVRMLSHLEADQGQVGPGDRILVVEDVGLAQCSLCLPQLPQLSERGGGREGERQTCNVLTLSVWVWLT